MAPQEIARLAAHVDSLDRETARRVARLVVECNADVALALRAVHETDHNALRAAAERPGVRSSLGRMLAYFGSTRAAIAMYE